MKISDRRLAQIQHAVRAAEADRRMDRAGADGAVELKVGTYDIGDLEGRGGAAIDRSFELENSAGRRDGSAAGQGRGHRSLAAQRRAGTQGHAGRVAERSAVKLEMAAGDGFRPADCQGARSADLKCLVGAADRDRARSRRSVNLQVPAFAGTTTENSARSFHTACSAGTSAGEAIPLQRNPA
jgi:hypothetical protein